jgi:HD-like signal output (HDOD) protein
MLVKPFHDLDAWVAFYSQASVPVLRHTVQGLEQMREKADKVNARSIAAIILNDPLMTLRVLRYIEDHRQKRQTTDITTIERALMMIGIEPFFRDFQELPIVEEQFQDQPKALLGLLKVINRARKAANWAREWAIMRHDLDVDEITVATLLHEVANILMWCFAPALALKGKEMQAADHSLRSATMQIAIYNIHLSDLQTRLCQIWKLPELLLTLMDETKSESARARNVLLASSLARHSANGWDDAALPDDFKDVAALLHISHESLMRKLGIEMPKKDDGSDDDAQPQ